jgi:hypothetical protein
LKKPLKRGQALKADEAALSMIVSRRYAVSVPMQKRLDDNYYYRAAMIVRNVFYRQWTVEDVAFHLSMIAGDDGTQYEKQRARFDKGLIP